MQIEEISKNSVTCVFNSADFEKAKAMIREGVDYFLELLDSDESMSLEEFELVWNDSPMMVRVYPDAEAFGELDEEDEDDDEEDDDDDDEDEDEEDDEEEDEAAK
jgi:hypothetical protein